MNEVEKELKRDLRKAGLTQRDAATFMNMRYPSFNNCMNGFSCFTPAEKMKLQGFIDQRLKALEQLNRAEAGIQSLESSK